MDVETIKSLRRDAHLYAQFLWVIYSRIEREIDRKGKRINDIFHFEHDKPPGEKMRAKILRKLRADGFGAWAEPNGSGGHMWCVCWFGKNRMRRKRVRLLRNQK